MEIVNKGDCIVLSNLDHINELYSIKLEEGMIWKVNSIIGSHKGWDGMLPNKSTFLFLCHNPSFEHLLPLSIEDLEKCMIEIFPAEKTRYAKL